MKKSNINLMESYLAIEKRKSSKTDRVKILTMILVGIILISAAYAAKLIVENIFIEDNIKTVSNYVNDVKIQQKVALIDEKQRKITDLNQIDAILTELNASFDLMPRINTLTLNLITSNLPAGTSLSSLSFDGQLFTILVFSPDFTRPSEFAINLRNSDFFEEVQYLGYSSISGPGTARYLGKINAILKVGG